MNLEQIAKAIVERPVVINGKVAGFLHVVDVGLYQPTLVTKLFVTSTEGQEVDILEPTVAL